MVHCLKERKRQTEKAVHFGKVNYLDLINQLCVLKLLRQLLQRVAAI